jgi:hypothetical protein
MITEADQSEKGWLRKAALEEIDHLKLVRATSWEQHSHSFKWLMASLLAVNGGALLAVFDSQYVSLGYQAFASGCFVIGIMAALLVAVFGQRSIQKSFPPLQKIIGYWMTVVEDGERLESLETDLNNELQTAVKYGRGAQICGWLSALAFLVGAGGVGVEMYSSIEASHTELTLPQ